MKTKTKTKHTPGPWTLYYEGSIYALAKDTGRKYDDQICVGLGFDSYKEFNDNSECGANARLIAAAPDLLKAVEAAQAYIQDPDGQNEKMRRGDIPKLPVLLREALAKAQGK